ncbi:hypothetical protein DFQ26_001381 [Actinomortierella ambigua]|nr:hypothetical protein DFQ26_001381 [Actinomortierella ambigua]
MDFVLTKHRLGAGCFGEVRLALWRKLPCAAKLTHLTTSDYDEEKLQQEISILSKLKHPHVVLFLGDVMYNGKLAIVMEYVAKGSLQNTIRNRLLSGWLEKERIMQDITMGVAYIHSQKILHCDLKSGNVLLDHSMRAKICDFGLSTVQTATASLSSRSNCAKGTTRWMAPELFSIRPKYSTKSDMYALGCIMWEVAADSTPPFAEQLDVGTVIRCVERGDREVIPDETPQEYRHWIEQCWGHDPASRPEAIDIVRDSIDLESFDQIDAADLDLDGVMSTDGFKAGVEPATNRSTVEGEVVIDGIVTQFDFEAHIAATDSGLASQTDQHQNRAAEEIRSLRGEVVRLRERLRESSSELCDVLAERDILLVEREVTKADIATKPFMTAPFSWT